MLPLRTLLWATCAALLLGAPPLRAASSLLLTYPESFATVPAATYDVEGGRIGGAHLVIERDADGVVKMATETGFDAGPRTVLTAALAPMRGKAALRPLWQESRSFDAQGMPMGMLRVDHERRVASCTPGPDLDPDRAIEVALPDGDRVANVPLQLLFLPLVNGEKERVDFQFFLCGGGARLMDFRARVAGRRNGGPDGRRLIEVRYGPDFGTLGSLLAQSMLPRLSIWFDPRARQPWLGHRVPLYSDGPEVLVVRDGVPPAWLGE